MSELIDILTRIAVAVESLAQQEAVVSAEEPRPAEAPSPLPTSILERLNRPPHPEAVAKLKANDYPQEPPIGRKRAPHARREGIRLSAEHFALWLQAYELAGVYKPEQMEQLYDIFCEMDHRHPQHINMVMGALAGLGRRYGIVRRDISKLRKWVVIEPKWGKQLFQMSYELPAGTTTSWNGGSLHD